jgi:hypothetical protein
MYSAFLTLIDTGMKRLPPAVLYGTDHAPPCHLLYRKPGEGSEQRGGIVEATSAARNGLKGANMG